MIKLLALASLILLSGCSSLLYYPYVGSAVDPLKLKHKPEQVTIETSDHLKLRAWYFRTPQRPAKGTLAFFHGNAENLTTHFYAIYWILDQGYDYLIFDYRGYGESEGKPDPKGTVEDGKAALRYLSQVKAQKPVYIFAQSLGGAIALKTACEVKDEKLFDKIVVDSTFLSYQKTGQQIMAKNWITWPFQWLSYLVLSDRYAPGDCVKTLSPHPMLVIHGTDDQTIPFELGEKVFATAKEPKEFWRIDQGRHTDFMFKQNLKYRSALLEWLSATSHQ